MPTLQILRGRMSWPFPGIRVGQRRVYILNTDSRQEAQQSAVTLEEDHPNVVESALAFMYKGDYKDYAFANLEDPDRMSSFMINFYVRDFAEKYDMPELECLANTKFGFRVKTNWSSPEFADAVRKSILQGIAAIGEVCARTSSKSAASICVDCLESATTKMMWHVCYKTSQRKLPTSLWRFCKRWPKMLLRGSSSNSKSTRKTSTPAQIATAISPALHGVIQPSTALDAITPIRHQHRSC